MTIFAFDLKFIMIHQLNIYIHVAAGTIALVLGAIILLRRKGTRLHKKSGRFFIYLLAIVTATGFIGWLFFRTSPFLLMLTMLAGYNTFSGYRIVKLKANQGSWPDLVIPMITFVAGLTYLFYLTNTDGNWSPSVIYSAVSAILLVTLYDIFKNLLFHHKIKNWWLYEHIYKIVSAFSAVLSAFIGTILPSFKPYSQIGPSSFCVFLIVFFIWREVKKSKIEIRPALKH